MSIIEISSRECRKFRQDISTKKDCVDVGGCGAVIISVGGKEIGEQGEKFQAAIQKEAGHSGLRIIGPNCV
jgi:acetyltransferase